MLQKQPFQLLTDSLGANRSRYNHRQAFTSELVGDGQELQTMAPVAFVMDKERAPLYGLIGGQVKLKQSLGALAALECVVLLA